MTLYAWIRTPATYRDIDGVLIKNISVDTRKMVKYSRAAKVSLRIAGAEQLFQVKRMLSGIDNVLFSTFPNFTWVRSSGSLSKSLGKR